ncbi:MAG: HAMP domain-containing histidine kinase, partial [Calothrix sp. SM1_5_4]|nr:HAMP domain-containing histidine kinase [Calothrix sp. SM1_5_4]
EARWPYAVYQLIIALAAIAGMAAWLSWLSARMSRREALARWEAENRSQIQFAAFAARVAHDIRSPLSALQIATCRLDDLPPETRGLISGAAGRIQSIATEILDFSRKNGSRTEPDPSPSLLEAVRSLIREKQTEYAGRDGLRLELSPNVPGGLSVNMPPNDIQRILSNLINNAVEALDKNGGKVTVHIACDDSFACLTVSDDGPGIPIKILKRLGKERLSYGKAGLSGSGTGLGLYSAASWRKSMAAGWRF